MTVEQANESLQRILSMFAFRDEASSAAYVSAIHEGCGWMPAVRFDSVCKMILTEMGNGKRPVPASYIAIYQRLGAELGWFRADSLRERPSCDRCGGCTWVYTRMARLLDGHEDYWGVPCPACNKNHPANQMPIPTGWAHMGDTMHIQTLNTLLSSLTPSGAQWLLAQQDALERAKFDEPTLAKILEIAGGREA